MTTYQKALGQRCAHSVTKPWCSEERAFFFCGDSSASTESIDLKQPYCLEPKM